jgi:hypothetical protein
MREALVLGDQAQVTHYAMAEGLQRLHRHPRITKGRIASPGRGLLPCRRQVGARSVRHLGRHADALA